MNKYVNIMKLAIVGLLFGAGCGPTDDTFDENPEVTLPQWSTIVTEPQLDIDVCVEGPVKVLLDRETMNEFPTLQMRKAMVDGVFSDATQYVVEASGSDAGVPEELLTPVRNGEALADNARMTFGDTIQARASSQASFEKATLKLGYAGPVSGRRCSTQNPDQSW